MKLSLIIPVYNAQDTLQRCLDSIFSQSLDDYELILVNDGSKDLSQSIIDEYKSRYPQIIKFVVVENGGQGRARNIGLELAKGEYIGFVDSDDWISPDMFPKMLATAEAEKADIVICDFIACCDKHSKIYNTTFVDGILLSSAGSCWNKLFRRAVVGQVRFPEGLWYEDLYFTAMLLISAHKIVHIPEGLYYYLCTNQSIMRNNNSRKNLDLLQIMDMLEADVIGKCGRDDFEYLVINHVLLDSINRLAAQSGSDKKAVIKQLRDYVHEKVPAPTKCPSFSLATRKWQIIMRLNNLGLQRVSWFILQVRKRLR